MKLLDNPIREEIRVTYSHDRLYPLPYITVGISADLPLSELMHEDLGEPADTTMPTLTYELKHRWGGTTYLYTLERK